MLNPTLNRRYSRGRTPRLQALSLSWNRGPLRWTAEIEQALATGRLAPEVVRAAVPVLLQPSVPQRIPSRIRE